MRVLIGFLALIGLLGGGLVASGAVQLTSPTPAPKVALATSTVPPVVKQQLESIDRALIDARTAGKPVPITLIFTEADLQASVAALFPQTLAGVTFSDPVVRLPSQLVLEANAAASILRSRAIITATPVVVAGRVSARIDSVSLGALPVPDQLRSSISEQLSGAMASIVPPKLTITTISVADGKLAVVGSALP